VSDRDQDAERIAQKVADAQRKQEIAKELREQIRDDPKLQAKIREQLLRDLIRVYNDEDNNSIVTPVSRRCYRDLGHFPEILVGDFFGQHAEFLRAAGLQDRRGTARSQNRSARLHTEQEIHRFAKENVLRFHGKYDFAKGKRTHLEGVVASDLHSLHCDPFARYCLMRAVEQIQPDVIVVNGDAVDFPSISTHPKLPGHFHLNLQQEVDWAKDLFRELRRLAPNAAIYFVIGNHEYRLVRYLADTAPALASLRDLSFNHMFGLDEFQVSLVCRSNFLAPSQAARKEDVAENWLVLGDCYVATHGSSCAKFAAETELMRFCMSGTSGHTHRPQVYYHHTPGTGAMSWMSTPMMCHKSDGRDFVHSAIPWNMGFGIFSIDPKKKLVSQQIVQVHEDVCFFAGSVFTPTKATLDARRKMMEVAA
jgi:hypothetical protein